MEIINPTDQKHWLELRIKDITSTEVSALFGLSPYCTKFELWHRKKRGDVVSIEENQRMRWGQLLQNSIAEGIAKDNNWKIRPMTEYIRDPLLRAGSSFDFEVTGTTLPDEDEALNIRAILEIKNVDGLAFKNGWIVDGEYIEAPAHIELQLQHQMMISGHTIGYIGALVGGNDVKLIKRTLSEDIIRRIKNEIAEFWVSIENNQPPLPNFAADAGFISKLYGFAEPNKIYDATGNEALTAKLARHKELGEKIKELDTERDAIKAEVLITIGDSEKVVGDGFSISAGVVAAAEYMCKRAPYRMFKPTWKKIKGT
jgi:putative phage-type endonuclease